MLGEFREGAVDPDAVCGARAWLGAHGAAERRGPLGECYDEARAKLASHPSADSFMCLLVDCFLVTP